VHVAREAAWRFDNLRTISLKLALFDEYRLGLVSADEQTITDITDQLPWPSDPDPQSAGWWRRLCRDFGDIRADLVANRDSRPLETVHLRAPVLNPSKVIGVAINYPDHLVEMRDIVMARTGTDQAKWMLEFDIFLKAPSSIVGPNDAVRLPDSLVRDSKEVHHECELAIIIGEGGSRITAATALRHVFGYTIALDITERGAGDRSRRKSWDTFTPLGPWITTADSIAAPDDLTIHLEIDGQVKQHANTRDMIVGIPGIIAYASSVMTLESGDVILTGAPPGVGAIRVGDIIDAQISDLGRLRIPVVGEENVLAGPSEIGTARKGEPV
jgi:2-keto-4-pentenoate hydratase/2-oxohepta-3-ene-1,7-dioic acid hydratase in catechol pathway